jgi:hypothetical protein
MNPWRWVDPRIRSVRLDGVRRYLDRKGWRPQPNPNPSFLRYEPPAAQNGRLPPFCVIPSSESFSDFAQSIVYFITTLSEVEDRHPVEVLDEILQAQGDEHATSAPPAVAR